jgi:transglutaminase-like putative cysteine protease
MANSSPLYQMADSKIIEPVLSSSFTKRLPVLGQQAGNWYNTITQEAVKTGPADGKAFLTWQTRFASNAEIDDTAKSVVQGATSDREKALKLYQWIGSHITYDDTKAMLIESGRYQTLTFGAVPTFQTRKGVCSDYSSLMVAMGRAIGLEVQQEVGMGVLPDGSSGPHAWNVVYLKDENKRIPCDPTWEQAGNFFDNGDFYETHHPDKLSI